VLALLLIAIMFAELTPIPSIKKTQAANNVAEFYETSGVTTDLKKDDIVWLDASDTTNPFSLHGLVPQDGAPYARMDLTVAEAIAGSKVFSKTSVYSHARESAGGRIRFTTTSPYLAIKAEFPLYANDYATGMKTGKYGFDIYVQNTETGVYEYYDTLGPATVPTYDTAWGYEDIVEFDDESAKNIMIYLPITNELSDVHVGLKDTSYVVDSIAEYEDAAPIVYYGSSITQGGMATKPGNTYVNTIGRKLNYDYVDLGVWGSCKAETEFANYIASLNMSAFVFDYDHNESDAAALADKHHAFYKIVRETHPDLPIIFVTRPDPQASGLHVETKAVIKASYDKAVVDGDTNVYFIDGESFFGYEASYLHDGVHPTDEGQARMAEVIGNKLATILPVTEPTMNETVVMTDNFDAGTEWNAGGRNWRVTNAEYAGPRTGVAPLGWNATQSRNLYNNSQMTDVHLSAKVQVNQAMCYGSKTQYHMLIARGGADGSGSIGFGFKTEVGANKMSMIVCQHQRTQNPQSTIYYETSATYSFNQEYALELFVVGNKIIAKCDGAVIYAAEVAGIATKGYCGMIDMRATDGNTSNPVKAGYFDDFKLSRVVFDSAKVDGAIICNPNGVGVADMMQYSGDIKIGSIEDRQVTVSGYSNKAPGRYVGPVEVTCDGKTWTTAIDQVVYVVEDVTKAVTSMNDSHWSQLNSAGNVKNPTWKAGTNNGTSIDGTGKVTLGANYNNYLAMNTVTNKKSAPYSNFYAEYQLTIDKVPGATESQALFDTRYFTEEHSNTTDGAIARITYSNNTLTASLTRSAGSYAYTNTNLTRGLAVGKTMKIGLLVCDGVLSYYVNDILVGTMTMGDKEGWFILKNNKPAMITATVENFIYVPLTGVAKEIQGCSYSYPSQILQGSTLTVSAVPTYKWPYHCSKGTPTTTGVAINGLDTSTCGVKKFTATYNGGYEKELEVEVSGPVKGAIVCDPNGVGVADLLEFTGGECKVLEEQAITVSGYSNKKLGRYIGEVEVTSNGQTWTTVPEQEIYVVEDVTKAVTSMRDSRWSQLNSAGNVANATWTLNNNNGTSIDDNGKVTLGANYNNYLAINTVTNKKSEPYSNFYAEYKLTIDKVPGAPDEQALFDTRYFTEEHSNTTDGAIARITYANGALSASVKRAAGSYPYTSKNFTDGLALGKPMKIGILVCEGVFSFYVNNELVGTMTMDETEGWFILRNNKPTVISAAIEDFIYIPLDGMDKTLLDCEYSYPSRVLKGSELEVMAIPTYNWPYGEGKATAQGVEIKGLDTSTCGKKTFTVTYQGENEQELQVEVSELLYEERFDGTKADLTDNAWNSANCTLENGKAVMEVGQNHMYATTVSSYKKWTDYTVSAEVALVKQEGTGNIHTAGIVARTTGANDGYEWALYAENDTTSIRFYDRKTGDKKFVNYPIDMGEFYTLKLTVEGDVIRGYVGNEKVLETTATTRSQGSVGIRRSGAYSAIYDNLVVTLPEEDVPVADITTQQIWFTDTFEAETSMSERGWSIDGIIQNGKLNLGGDGSQYRTYLSSIDKSSKWTDYTAQVDVTIGVNQDEKAKSTTNVSALVVRSHSTNSGYEFGVTVESATGTGSFRLYDRTNSKILATSKDIVAERGKTYQLTAVVEGNRIRCFVDGALVIDIVDDANSKGYAGLRTNGYTGTYDNFMVRKVTDADRVGRTLNLLSPGTGDFGISILIPVLGIALSFFAVTYVLRRRRRNDEC